MDPRTPGDRSLAARERRTLPIRLLASPLAFLCLTALPAAAFPAPGKLILSHGGAVLTLDPVTGDRTELSGSSIGSGVAFSSRPIDLVREQSGDFVVADFDVQALIRVDGATGDRSVLASSVVGSGGTFRPGALEIDGDLRIDPANDGTLLVWNSNASAIERVDPVSGDRTVIASASIGTGPNPSAVQDMLRFGPGLFSLDDVLLDLMVTDSNLDALLLVSTYTGERVVLSSASVGSGTGFVIPRGIAMVPPPASNANDLPVFYVVDSGLDAIVGVDLVFTGADYVGDRQIVSSASIGSGPDFDFPYNIWPSPDGGLYVSDLGLDAIFHVDPATGDRTIVSDAVTGVGPALGGVRSFTAVPEPAFAWSFETEAPGQPPAYTVPFPSLIGGAVTVERAVDFAGSVLAAEGERVLYLTTGPGFRGDPASVGGQFDESFLALPVYRGQNAPRRLRLSVDYLTDEGPEPDPTDVVALQTGQLFSSPLALLSMQTVNPSPSPFGGAYSALTGFADGPIAGPDGSSFGEGHVGYLTYEIEVDFPGAGLYLRVADEGDGDNDSAMLVDDIRFVPEPRLAASIAAGGLLVASLRRRRADRCDLRATRRPLRTLEGEALAYGR